MFIFEPDPDLIAEMEAEDTNVVKFPQRKDEPALPCDVEPTGSGDAA